MSEVSEKYDIPFYQLVVSLHAAAMQQMGKVASPLTGKIERELEQAEQSINLLEMLQRKTEGNLNEDEKKLLDHVLYELQLNFVDEKEKKQDTGSTSKQETPPKATEESEEGNSEEN